MDPHVRTPLAPDSEPEVRAAAAPPHARPVTGSAAPGRSFRDRWLALAILSFFSSTTLLCTSSDSPDGDGRAYFAATDALARFGTFDGRAADIGRMQVAVLEGTGGGLYSRYPLGQSLIQLPFYWAAVRVAEQFEGPTSRSFIRILGLRLTPALLSGIAALLLFNVLRFYFHFTPRLSFLVCCIYVFGTVALAYSKTNYSEPAQAALLIGLLDGSLRPRRNPTLTLTVLSFAFSLLVLTKPALLILFPVFAYLALCGGSWRRFSGASAALSVVTVAAMSALFIYWNYVRTGKVWDVYGGNTQAVYAFHLSDLSVSLHNLLLSPYKNLFLFNPVLMLALPGFLLLRSPKYKLICAVMWLACLLLFGTYGSTWGSRAWGPRYLMPLTITLMPFVAATLDRVARTHGLRRLVAHALTAGVVAGSVYVSILGASYNWFHTKHLCAAYDAYRAAQPLPECEGDLLWSGTIAIHQYLFWKASYDKLKQGGLEEFPWLDRTYTPTLATQVLSHFRPRWFLKDFLFFNLRALVEDTTGPAVVAWGLGLTAATSLLTVFRLTRGRVMAI